MPKPVCSIHRWPKPGRGSRRLTLLSLPLWSLLLASPVLAEGWQARIVYQVRMGQGLWPVGEAEVQVSVGTKQYRIENQMRTTGLAALVKPLHWRSESHGTVREQHLQPRRFAFYRGEALNEQAQFVWGAKRLTLLRPGQEPQSKPLQPGAQDVLSLPFDLMLSPPESSVDLQITTGKKAELYRFHRVGEATLQLQGQTVSTVHYQSEAQTDGEQTDVWLAPSLQRLPVKIRQVTASGDVGEQTAQRIEWNQEPLWPTPKPRPTNAPNAAP